MVHLPGVLELLWSQVVLVRCVSGGNVSVAQEVGKFVSFAIDGEMACDCGSMFVDKCIAAWSFVLCWGRCRSGSLWRCGVGMNGTVLRCVDGWWLVRLDIKVGLVGGCWCGWLDGGRCVCVRVFV